MQVEVNEISSACFGAQTTLSQLSKEQAAHEEEDRAYVAQFVSDMGAFLHTGTEEVKGLGDSQRMRTYAHIC